MRHAASRRFASRCATPKQTNPEPGWQKAVPFCHCSRDAVCRRSNGRKKANAKGRPSTPSLSISCILLLFFRLFSVKHRQKFFGSCPRSDRRQCGAKSHKNKRFAPSHILAYILKMQNSPKLMTISYHKHPKMSRLIKRGALFLHPKSKPVRRRCETTKNVPHSK